MARRARASVAFMGLIGLLAGCGLQSPSDDAIATVCDGVGSNLGGCDADQPAFTSTSCDGVAAEFGAQLDERIVPVLRGEDVVDNEHKSVRMAHVIALVVTRANLYLRSDEVSLRCGSADFLDTAEAEFSPDLIEGAGEVMFGSGPRPYSDWRADVLKSLGAIEQDLN